MPKRRNKKPRISDEQWQSLVEFYSEQDTVDRDRGTKFSPSHVNAAKFSGVNYRTCIRAYDTGWGEKYPAIVTMLLSAKVHARAELVEVRATNVQKEALVEHRAKEAAKLDLVESRKAEAQIVRGERGNVVALVNITGKALRGMLVQADELERSVREGKDLATGKLLTTRQRFVLLSRISHLVERCATSGAAVIRMERLLLGEPTEIIGHRIEGLSIEDAEGKVIEAQAMVTRIKDRRARFALVPTSKSNGSNGANGSNGHSAVG